MGLFPVYLKPAKRQLFPRGTLLRSVEKTRGLFVVPNRDGYFHNTAELDDKSWAQISIESGSHVVFLMTVEVFMHASYSGVVLWKGNLYAVSLEDFDAIET